MKKLFTLLLIILFPMLISAQSDQAAQNRLLAFRNVTVIDMKSEQPKLNMTVVVSGNRISKIGRNIKIPKNAQVVDATGKFLIPGLWDMHAHLINDPPTEIDMPLLVANGVTGIREMISDCHPAWRKQDCLEQRRTWQRQIAAGELLGPRLLGLGSWAVNGPRGLPKGVPVYFGASNAEEGRQLARYFAERKVDFIKIYSGIPRDAFLALADEARRLGLSVVCHEPLAVSAIEASDAGMKSFEHARIFLFNCFPGAEEFRRLSLDRNPGTVWRRRMVNEFDSKICQEVFRVFVRNDTRYVPTHLTRKMDAFADNLAYRTDLRSKYIPKAQWKAWNEDADRMVALDSSPAGRKAMMDFYTKGLEITIAAHRAGVKIMLGTDSGDSYVFPGSAVHDELQELVTAGLTPAEALKTAIWNGAEFLGRTSDFGSIEKGKLADLVLLNANPLADISNTRKINAVVANGRYLSREFLDKMLFDIEAKAKGQ